MGIRMKLYRPVRKTMLPFARALLAWIDLPISLYAGLVCLLFLMAGVQEGYARTFDMLGALFFDGLGIPYSRWIHGVLVLGTIVLVVHYLARFIAYIQEQKEKKRFREHVTDILDPDPRDIKDLICACEAVGDLTNAERLKRKLEERLEELEDLRRLREIEEERRRVEEEEWQKLEPTKIRSATIEERSEIIEKLRRLREKRERERK